MQYPPQPPISKPSYPPTEMHLPELPLVNEEAQESAPAQKIVIYADRIRGARSLAALTNRIILGALMFVLLAYVLLSFINNTTLNNPALNFFAVLFIFVYVMMLARMALSRWIMGRSLLVSGQPIMVVDSAGITLRGAVSLSNIFIAWSEIESLDVYLLKYRYLCIRLRDAKAFTRRLPLLEQALKLIDSLYGLPPLYISLLYLDKPVEEILQQLYYMYAKELSYYRIQIRS